MIDVAKVIGEPVVAQFGGMLRCETCQRVETPQGEFMASGWPKCCGYTMRWWTQRQINAGEHRAS